jgi:hypothetical protein
VPGAIVWLQNRSVESTACRQYPFLQSASDWHGEQNVPSPTHDPARGRHTEKGTQDWSASQSPAPPHSGAHVPALQCWKMPAGVRGQSSSLLHAGDQQAPDAQCWATPFAAGQSASFVQGARHPPAAQTSVAAAAGQPPAGVQATCVHTPQGKGSHVASSGQLPLPAHWGEQKPEPLESCTQCWYVAPSAATGQSWSFRQGAQ